MAIKHMNIREVEESVRKKGVQQLKSQYQQALSNPTLTQEQRNEVSKQIRSLAVREAEIRKPQHHTVTVCDSLSVDEN